MNTKMLVAAAVVATVITSPALAQTRKSPSDFAQSRQHSVNPGHDVYVNGEYVGSDPDSNIRAQLRRGHGPEGAW